MEERKEDNDKKHPTETDKGEGKEKEGVFVADGGLAEREGSGVTDWAVLEDNEGEEGKNSISMEYVGEGVTDLSAEFVGNDYNDWSEYDSENDPDLTDNDNIYEEMLKIATLRNNRYDKWKKKDVSFDNNVAIMNYDKEKNNSSQPIPIPKEYIYVNTLKIK
jgi:hypothetical protein